MLGTNNEEKHPHTFDSMPRLAGSSFQTLQRFRINVNPERALYMERNSALTRKGLAVSIEQVSIFLTENNTVISIFQHSADDVEEPILKRLGAPDTILRRTADASMILQAVIDAIIDLAVPITAAYEDIMGELELDVLTDPTVERSLSLYILSSELYLLRSYMQPIANAIAALRDHSRGSSGVNLTAPVTDGTATPTHGKKPAIPTVAISSLARTYFGDVEDSCITITSNLDIMRRTTNDLIDLTYNQVGSFQNESMKQLTAVTIFFLPLTFLTGYFGQNFQSFGALDNSDVFFWKVAVPLIVATILVLMRHMLWRLIRRIWQRQWISRTRKARKGKKRVGRKI
jgi:Mg2+ and Co2+ transporter CorA